MNNKLDDEIRNLLIGIVEDEKLLEYSPAFRNYFDFSIKEIKSLCFSHERKRIKMEVEKLEMEPELDNFAHDYNLAIDHVKRILND